MPGFVNDRARWTDQFVHVLGHTGGYTEEDLLRLALVPTPPRAHGRAQGHRASTPAAWRPGSRLWPKRHGLIVEQSGPDRSLAHSVRRRFRPVVPPVQSEILRHDVEQAQGVPELGDLFVAEQLSLRQRHRHVVDLGVRPWTDAENLEQTDPLVEGGLVDDPVSGAQDIERVPTGQRTAEWVLPRAVFAETNDLSQDVNLLLRSEQLELFEEDIREDDLGLIVGKAVPASHPRRPPSPRLPRGDHGW